MSKIGENIDHHFLYGPYAAKGWYSLFEEFGVAFSFLKALTFGFWRCVMVFLLMREEKSFGAVQLVLFFGAFGRKGTTVYLKISSLVLSPFGFWCNTMPLSVQIILSSFVNTVFK